MSDAAATPQLELVEKLLKIANLQADTALKNEQTKYEPWKVVVSAVAAGGVIGGALVAAIIAVVLKTVG